ncbi:MAG: TonB-dependent receptor [Chitinophagaceae bacterium]|nr:MAG: TonB-dependent receptor [Chitinophagaceae bacterium]
MKYFFREKKLLLIIALVVPFSFVRAQTISGIVSSSRNGQPLPGVTVHIKGTSNGTNTDGEGRYSLSNARRGDSVVFSFVGFEVKTVAVNGSSKLDVQLEPSIASLNQVVVVGFGTQKRKDITGSIATVSSKDLTTVPLGDVTNALAGKLPGLIAVQGGGQPGNDGASLSIRGFGSPLVIVDGVQGRTLNDIDPSSIQSITVLKDAASAAVYGVNAGNGVIIVTTKKGSIGTPQLNYSFNYGLQHVTRYPKFVNSEQYAILKNEASTNLGGPVIYSPEDIEKYKKGTDPNFPNFNYFNYFQRNYTPQYKQDLTITGGSDKIKYFFLLGNLNQEAMWKSPQNFKRYNVQSNIDAKIGKNLDLSVQFQGRYELRNDLIQSSYLMASWMQYSWPIFAPKTPDGKIASTNYGLTAYLDPALTGYIKDERTRLLANATLTYNVPFVKGLSASVMMSRDMLFGNTKDWEKAYTTYQWDAGTKTSQAVGKRGTNELTLATAKVFMTNIQPSITYKNTFSSKHNVEALLLFNEQETNSNSFSANRTGYVVPIDQIFAGPTANQTNSGAASIDGKESVVGRVDYNYMNKYIIEYSFRLDGSDKFPPKTRWGYFQGISGGWVISQEPFFQKFSKAIDNLKLRASWGKLGDDITGAFQFLAGYTYPGSNSYIFGNNIVTNGMSPTNVPNPNITWETSRTKDLGIDIDLWNGLFGGTIDVFRRNRVGLLATRALQVPITFGATLPAENLNSDNTRGFEVSLDHDNQIGAFRYQVSLNYAFSMSRWGHVEQADFPSSFNKWARGLDGRNENIFWGLKAIGQFQSYKEIKSSPVQDGLANSTLLPGDIKYEDVNHDGVIDANDVVPIGKGNTPEVTYGANFSLGWKNFNLMLNFQGASGFDIEEESFLIEPFNNGMNAYAYFMDRWHRADVSDPNSTWIPGKFPATKNGGSPNNNKVSSFWLKNGTYVRLKAANLSYDLKVGGLVKRIGIDKITLSLSGYNLLTITGIPYIDPEAPSGRLSYYPQQTTYNFGANIQF